MALRRALLVAGLWVCSAAGEDLCQAHDPSSEACQGDADASLLQVNKRSDLASEDSGPFGGGRQWGKDTLNEDARSTYLGALPNKPAGDDDEHAFEETEELKDIPVLTSPVTLEVTTAEVVLPWVAPTPFTVRSYNGLFPGPTIRTKPGEKLEVNIVNKLGPKNVECPEGWQEMVGAPMNPDAICLLNMTNLHTHGLHVSPTGLKDNVWLDVMPGESLSVTFPLPENHMGGNHWYHPHHHHATSVQAGGGMHGALVVEDPKGTLPPEYEAMEEKIMVLSLVNLESLLRLEEWGSGDLWKNSNPRFKYDKRKDEPKLVVNGQYSPMITMESGKWYRFRMVYAAVEWYSLLSVGQGAQCQMQLLATDGIYLNEAPRPVTGQMMMASGARTDFAIACECKGGADSCGAPMEYRTEFAPIPMKGAPMVIDSAEGVAFQMKVVGTGQTPDLPAFSVNRPCYLVDLTDLPYCKEGVSEGACIPKENVHTIDLPTPPGEKTTGLIVKWDGGGHGMGKMTTTPPLAKLPGANVQEWKLTGIRYHPFHLHVVPYQIDDIRGNNFYQVGDWHDTLLPDSTNSATVRVQMSSFTGRYVVHCHILEHEDNGMMGYFQVEGEEGKVWSYARDVDPKCYYKSDGAGYKLLD